MGNGKCVMGNMKFRKDTEPQDHRAHTPELIRFVSSTRPLKKADASCTTTLYYVNLFKELSLHRRKLFSEFRPAHRLKQSYCVIGKASAKVYQISLRSKLFSNFFHKKAIFF